MIGVVACSNTKSTAKRMVCMQKIGKEITLSKSERDFLADRLKLIYEQNGYVFMIDNDTQLIYEALYVVAKGDPNRLFAILHPANKKNEHPEANHGETWHFITAVADGKVAKRVQNKPFLEELITKFGMVSATQNTTDDDYFSTNQYRSE